MLVARVELLDICCKDLTADPKRVGRRGLSVVLLDVQTGCVVKIDCERRDVLRVGCWLHFINIYVFSYFFVYLDLGMAMVCFVHEARTRPPAAYRHFFDNDTPTTSYLAYALRL